MSALFNSVSAILVLILIMAVGYGMGHGKWIGASEKKFISKYILNIAVPCMCITGVLNNMSRDDLKEMGLMFLASTITVSSMLILASILARALKLARKQKGIFVSMCSFANTLFIGIPVTTQILGNESIPYIMVYYLSNTALVQIVGILLIEHSGNVDAKLSIKGIAKSIFTKPPIIGVIVAFTMLLCDVAPPGFLMRFMGYISDTVSPFALIYCGYIIYEIGLKNLKFQKGLPLMLLCRLVVTPAICFGMTTILHIEGFPAKVLLIESALPVITQVTVMSGAYGADEKYSALGFCLSTILGFITLPIWVMLLS
ncbi:AEC family transporter [Lachnospiraceae bacterium ZAX-1]